MIKFKINGEIFEAQEGTTVIEVIDRAHLELPRFCYHPELSIAANCRMCLVEISTSAKPVPACMTPLCEGMEIFTKSPKALAAQKDVLEFLLINHPLDCPICDQGGECELQDLTVAHGPDRSSYYEEKRRVPNPPLGPLVSTEMNRCIHCTRCVRFGEEISGRKELGMFGRGEKSFIATFHDQPLSSSLAGNVIDLCPVGALTSKPHRYKGRTWQYVGYHILSLHDATRSRLTLHLYQEEIRRCVSYAELGSPDYWISDRDRFGYAHFPSQRALKPAVFNTDSWQIQNHSLSLEEIATTYSSAVAIVHPLLAREEAQGLLSYLDTFKSSCGLLTLDTHLCLEKDINITHRVEGRKTLIVIGDCLESHYPSLYLVLKKWLEENEDHQLLQLTVLKDWSFHHRHHQILTLPQQRLNTIEDLMKNFSIDDVEIYLCTQLLQHKSHYYHLIEECQKRNYHFTLIGHLAPYDHQIAYQEMSLGTISPEVVFLVHLESADWIQDKKIHALIKGAKKVVCLSSFLPNFKEEIEADFIPIAFPIERTFTAKTFWKSEALESEALPLTEAAQQLLSLQEMAVHFNSTETIRGAYQYSSRQSDNSLSLSSPEAISLLILKSAGATNLFLRRSGPFLETPAILEQKGFWVSQNLAIYLIDGRFRFRQGEMIYEGQGQIKPELLDNTVIYWSGVDSVEITFESLVIHKEDIIQC